MYNVHVLLSLSVCVSVDGCEPKRLILYISHRSLVNSSHSQVFFLTALLLLLTSKNQMLCTQPANSMCMWRQLIQKKQVCNKQREPAPKRIKKLTLKKNKSKKPTAKKTVGEAGAGQQGAGGWCRRRRPRGVVKKF